MDIIEELAGKYENILEELKRRKEDNKEDEDPIDIMYELESVHTDEINYEYILSLIQAFIPEGESEVPEFSDKDIRAIGNYITELRKTNMGLADIINNLWLQVKMNPERYRNQSVANILDGMIEEVIEEKVKEISDKWFIGYEELLFLVKNYRKGITKQRGEQELIKSQDYQAYKEAMGGKALSILKYKRAIKPAYTKVIEEVIEPLQRRQ